MKFHHVSPLCEKAVATVPNKYMWHQFRPRSLWEWDTQDSLPKQIGHILEKLLVKQKGIFVIRSSAEARWHLAVPSPSHQFLRRKKGARPPTWVDREGSGVEGVPTLCLLQPVLSPDWTWRYLMRVTSFWQQATPGYANSLSWAARQWDEARTGPWTTCQGVRTQIEEWAFDLKKLGPRANPQHLWVLCLLTWKR